MLHPSVDKDVPKKKINDIIDVTFEEEVFQQAWSRYLAGMFHCEFRAGEMNTLVSGFTNLGWASWFGPDYVNEVDKTAICAAGFPLQKIGGGYLVQVTDDINDVINEFALFSKRRAELKSLFRDDLFLIKDEPKVF